MSPMMLSYYIIKYVADQGNGEEWPIGVVANDGQKAYFRALGVKSRSEVDHTPLCYLTGLNAADAWPYYEWADWFFDVIENEGTNPAGFEKVMGRLQATGTSITVEPGSSVLIPKGKDAAAIVDQLYEQHVAS